MGRTLIRMEVPALVKKQKVKLPFSQHRCSIWSRWRRGRSGAGRRTRTVPGRRADRRRRSGSGSADAFFCWGLATRNRRFSCTHFSCSSSSIPPCTSVVRIGLHSEVGNQDVVSISLFYLNYIYFSKCYPVLRNMFYMAKTYKGSQQCRNDQQAFEMYQNLPKNMQTQKKQSSA